MNFLKRLFSKNKDGHSTQGNLDEFMTLIRVYFQGVMAINLGITNIRFLPDLAQFKRMMNIATTNGKLGLAEKNRAQKILTQYYGVSEEFFPEIDKSVKKNCKNVQQINNYFSQFQGFSNDLFLLIGNLMQWKSRIPSSFRKTLYAATQKTVQDILTKSDWKAADVRKTTASIRKYKEVLGFSEAWITEYVFNILILAKKEKPGKTEEKKNQ